MSQVITTSSPPPEGAPGGLGATSIAIAGHHHDLIEAYGSQPEGVARRGGVVVIHHLPGYDRATKEIVRRFAELGYDAICPNLYWREAPGAQPDDAAAVARSQGGIPDEQVVGDVGGAVEHLRSLPTSNGRVGVIGFCSGGRHAVLAGCHLEVDAVIDCYGAFVVGTVPDGFPIAVSPFPEKLPRLSGRLLGLFGNEDRSPSRARVDELEQLLVEHGKPHELHRFDDAGHAFFSSDRPSYNVAAANRGWELISDFLRRSLSGEA